MCNGASATDSINTFNGNDAVKGWFFREDGFGHDWPNGSHANQPMMWTEDEMWFDAWPSASLSVSSSGSSRGARNSWGYQPMIPAGSSSDGHDDDSRSWNSATPFQVARFFARGAVLHNFYMWFGGNNYERTAGGDVKTAYADSAPLHSDTMRNEPPFSHLTKLHMLLHRLSGVLSNSVPQIGNGTNCTTMQGGISSVVAFRYHDATEDVVFIENSNETATLHAQCWGRQYSVSHSSIQIASTTTGEILWASDEAPSTPSPTRTYTPVHDKPFAWKAYSEPLTLSESSGESVVSSRPLEQLNLTGDLTGFCVYQTSFSHQEQSAAELLVVTGRTNNAYIVAIDGQVVAKLEHHKNGVLDQVVLNASIPLSAWKDSTAQHTLTVVSSSLGLRNDNIFADSREAKGFELLTLGALNMTAQKWQQRAGLVGETSDVTRLQPSLTVANTSMVWLQSTFVLDTKPNGTSPTYVFDASGLGRGYIYVNNFSLGRYWPIVPIVGISAPGQRYYHVPPDCLQQGTNLVKICEEIGAPHPELARLATVALKVDDDERSTVWTML